MKRVANILSIGVLIMGSCLATGCNDDEQYVGPPLINFLQTKGYLYSADSVSYKPYAFKKGTSPTFVLGLSAPAGLKLLYLTSYSNSQTYGKYPSMVSEVQDLSVGERHQQIEFSLNPSIDWASYANLQISLVDQDDQVSSTYLQLEFLSPTELLKRFVNKRLYNPQSDQPSGMNFSSDQVLGKNDVVIYKDMVVNFNGSKIECTSNNGALFKVVPGTVSSYFLKTELAKLYSQITALPATSVEIGEGTQIVVKMGNSERYALVKIKKIATDALSSAQGGSDNDYIDFEYIY